MVAVHDQILRRLIRPLNVLNDLLKLPVVILEERTQPALTFVNSLHIDYSLHVMARAAFRLTRLARSGKSLVG